jgi:hypothetical protein
MEHAEVEAAAVHTSKGARAHRRTLKSQQKGRERGKREGEREACTVFVCFVKQLYASTDFSEFLPGGAERTGRGGGEEGGGGGGVGVEGDSEIGGRANCSGSCVEVGAGWGGRSGGRERGGERGESGGVGRRERGRGAGAGGRGGV